MKRMEEVLPYKKTYPCTQSRPAIGQYMSITLDPSDVINEDKNQQAMKANSKQKLRNMVWLLWLARNPSKSIGYIFAMTSKG